MSDKSTFVVPLLSDELFAAFRQLIQLETGIYMRDSKKLLLSNRVKKRMRQTGMESFSEYFEFLQADAGEERPRFIDAVTTNETYFYRGESHFEALRQTILPWIFARRQKVRMWSVGCSTGEEAYTLAMVALEAAGPRHDLPIEVLATDISTAVVGRASLGVYDEHSLRCLPAAMRDRYFAKTPSGAFRVNEEVRRLVRFSVHNALREKPPAADRDVIFCRNVMIYFDTPTQKRLVDEKFAPSLAPDGFLFIGHSESLIGKSRCFTFTRVHKASVYRPTAAGAES